MDDGWDDGGGGPTLVCVCVCVCVCACARVRVCRRGTTRQLLLTLRLDGVDALPWSAALAPWLMWEVETTMRLPCLQQTESCAV